jgi:hypothetical protein
MKRLLAVLILAAMVAGCKSGKPNAPQQPATQPEAQTQPAVNAPAYVVATGQQLMHDGKQIQFRADTAWEIVPQIGGDRGKTTAYLNRRKEQGFDTVLLSCSGDWFAKDVAKPNLKLFERLDALFDDAAARGMYLIVIAQTTEYAADGTAIMRLPKSQAEAIGHFYGARYATRRNLIMWLVGGLDNRIASPSELQAFASGIRRGDSNHLITYHPLAGRTTLYAFPVGPLHQVALYQSHHVYDAGAQRGMLYSMKASGLPFANIEGAYEGTPGISVDQVVLSAEIAKEFPVCGYVYGHTDVWPFGKGWQAALNAGGVAKWMRATR